MLDAMDRSCGLIIERVLVHLPVQERVWEFHLCAFCFNSVLN